MLLFSSKHSWLTVAVRNLGGVWQQAAACNCQVSAVIETVYELWGILIRAQLHGMTPIQGARAIVQTRTAANLWLEYINLTDSQKCTFHVSSNQITWWLQCMEYAKGGSNVESETSVMPTQHAVMMTKVLGLSPHPRCCCYNAGVVVPPIRQHEKSIERHQEESIFNTQCI